ncbi:MAG: glycoside hydrolase family 3 N-terminal domain-containing protein [Bacteroidota bacterium]
MNRSIEDISTDELPPPFLCCETEWADSVFASLAPDERIAQLFMVAAYSNKGKADVDKISKLINNYNIGGLIFFKGAPVRQAKLTNYYQSIAKTPLLIAIDAEWGLAMRLDSTIKFPYQMTLGAIRDDDLIYEMGAEIARQCKRLGIHVNLAPVVDVNNNPLNPVINFRSFGENKYKVARKGIAYMKGLQDNGVLSNAKHFPGHGDTDTDSHKALPILTHTKKRMDTLELYPFKELIKQGLGSIMTAHLHIPAYQTEKNTASSLSKNIVSDLLMDSLGFKGLVFTDALNMKGVSSYFEPGIVDVKALLAGNDVLLYPQDVPKAISGIKLAIEKGEITQVEIDKRCKKILMAKQWAQLNDYQPVEIDYLHKDLNNKTAALLNRKLVESSLTLLSNRYDIIPLRRLDTLHIASLSIGTTIPFNPTSFRGGTDFQKILSNYAPVEHFSISKNASREQIVEIINKLSKYNLVIVGIHDMNNAPSKNFGVTEQSAEIVNGLRLQSRVVLTFFGSPYGLSSFDGIENVEAVIMAYEDGVLFQELSAQLIFGGIQAMGKLPVSVNPYFDAGTGITSSQTIKRFKYTIPEETGIDSKELEKIDSIVLNAIKEGAAPGCQVLVAKQGKVIYHKSFGYHTYDEKMPVKNTDIYDLASITKIAATVASLMKLRDEEKFDIDKNLGDYLPYLENTNKDSINIRELLAHHARLRSWIPFWMKTAPGESYRKKYEIFSGLSVQKERKTGSIYSTESSDEFPTRVAKNLFIRHGYTDSIMQDIIDSPLRKNKEYYYSDLGYYLLYHIIEKITGEPIEDYVHKNFYAPLGLSTMGYKPRERFGLERIVPTENDMVFRKQLIHGDVHDPGAAMMGGVGGHAGVFSNANDLAILMQMFLQKGEYGGKRYFKASTIDEFTKCQFCEDDNRRGAGFDRPEMDPEKEGPNCKCVSAGSFGHTGFTGAIAWADPEEEVVYIFLSNRVHPDADNKKLIRMNIRTLIQQAIYDAISKSKGQADSD